VAARAIGRRLIAALIAAVPASIAGASGLERPDAELLLFLAEFGAEMTDGEDAAAAVDSGALPEALLDLLDPTEPDDREHDRNDHAPPPAPRRR
jgi:hypothetical protein